jgi:hypothetical protein
MSVSYNGGGSNGDLSALLGSEDQFNARLADYAAKTEALRKQYLDIPGLGNIDARHAHDQAQSELVRVQREYTLHQNRLEAERRQHQDNLDRWVDETKTQMTVELNDVRHRLADAVAQHNEATNQLEAAKTASIKATAAAKAAHQQCREQVLAKMHAANAKAFDILAAAQDEATKAEVALNVAKAEREKWETALAALKGAKK